MSISTETVKVIRQGDGETTVFPYGDDIPIIQASDLAVYLVDADGITPLSAHYTVDTVEGEVTYPNDPETTPILEEGEFLVFLRETPATQESTYTEFSRAVLEAALDKQTMIIQEIREQLSRTIRYPITEEAGGGDPDEFIADVEAIVDAGVAIATAQAAIATAQAAVSTAQAVAAAASAVAAAASAGLISNAVISDVWANRPAAPTSISFFYATDNKSLEVYIPAAARWFLIG